MNRLTSLSRLCLLASFVAIVAGCASPASREAMTVAGTPVTKKFASTVSVKVGGGAASADGGPVVGNDDMKAAIETSIRNRMLFKSIAATGSDYELTVVIARLDRPSFGLSFTVEMEAGWTLMRIADKAIVMRKSVTSTSTATASDAIVGATRIRLAVEGAARNNIASGLEAIAALDL